MATKNVTSSEAAAQAIAAPEESFQMQAYRLALLANAMQLSISESERGQGSHDKSDYKFWLNKAVTNTKSQGNWGAVGSAASVGAFVGRFFFSDAGSQKTMENISGALPSIFGIAAQNASAEVTKANGNTSLISTKMQSGSQEAANFRSAVTDQAMQGAREAMRMNAEAAKSAAGG